MGALTSPEGRLLPEVKARVNSAYAAFGDYRRQIFGAGCLSSEAKFAFLDVFLDTRIFYGSESWVPRPSDIGPITTAHIKFCRTILGMTNAGQLRELRTSDVEVVRAACRPSPPACSGASASATSRGSPRTALRSWALSSLLLLRSRGRGPVNCGRMQNGFAGSSSQGAATLIPSCANT